MLLKFSSMKFDSFRFGVESGFEAVEFLAWNGSLAG